MIAKLHMNGGSSARVATSALALALAAAAIIAIALVLSGLDSASAQDEAGCELNHLGSLGSEAGDRRQTSGSWTTNDCDSRFREGSDAVTYRVSVEGTGRVRIDLTSTGADSYLYLLTQDGRRIADDDDGGAGLNARIERDLEPGVYLIEATTVGGRDRGAADFRLTVSRVRGCEPVHLGNLVPGEDLTTTGTWDINTCGSRFVASHPAYGYSFNLPQDGRVLVDLVSENGDPVLSMISASGAVIGANDDGGGGRNSRIEQYLTAGIYFIEATTYLQRDLQPLFAEFTLTIRLVDEEAEQGKFLLKMEETYTPDRVIAGEPFQVDYRVGNLGGGDFGDAGRIVLYVVAPREFDRIPNLYPAEGTWQAGNSYHTAPRVAGSTSTTNEEVPSFTLTLNQPGPSWVFVAVIAFDHSDEEIAFHGIWRNLMVLSAATFDPVTVKVDGVDYSVSAVADLDGQVSHSVTSVTDANAEIGRDVREKAIYAAGVKLQLLDEIFERPAIASLSTTAEPSSFELESPTTGAVFGAIAEQYVSALDTFGLTESLTEGVAVNPVVVETLVLSAAKTASARYAGMAASWSDLLERTEGGGPLSFEEAFEVQSQLAYAESIVPPLVTAGEIVQAARDAELGWDAADVVSMLADLRAQGACRADLSALSDALEDVGVSEFDALVAQDEEIRTALPVFGALVDSAICGAGDVDDATNLFLQRYALSRSNVIGGLLEPEPEIVLEPVIEAQDLRIIARLRDDGRIEHGVELSNGEQVLPSARSVPAGAPVDVWLLSGDVEVEERAIGNIRSRRLESGRVEVGFVTAAGEEIVPDIRYLPTGLTVDVWLRSSEVEVPPPPPSRDRPAEYTQVLVKQAIERYEETGLDSTVEYYNTAESIDGQWYVFIMEDETMLAHAADPALVGRPVSAADGPNGYPAGEILAAVADADGEWSDYTFPNPATGEAESKHSWVVLYDGLVFGSGWYEPGPSKSDAPAYTQSVVEQALSLYDALGREAVVEYYNTEESIDGQWYVFIIDENDTMLAHAANPDLVNRPVSAADGPNGYPAGEILAAVADADGEWSDYTFPNPATGEVESKHSWVIRHDGLVFGSGWYEPGPSKTDAPAYTQSFVEQAITLYDALGREAAVNYYNSEESVDGQWYVFIVDDGGYTISHFNPMFIGRDPSLRVDAAGYFYGDDLLSATEEGSWVDYVLVNPATGDDRQKHTWAVLYDGLIFASGWYEEGTPAT